MKAARWLIVALCSVAFAFAAAAPEALGASGWYELGPGQNPFTGFNEFDLVDSSGVPLIGWSGDDPNGPGQGVFTATFDGHPLEAQPWKYNANGNGAFTPDGGLQPSLAIVGGTLYAAAVSATDANVRVARLIGTTWQQVGTGSLNINSVNSAFSVHIADVGGVPYVSWTEGSDCNRIAHVKRWNGSSWVELGSGATPLQADHCDNAEVNKVTDIGGAPYVAMLILPTGDPRRHAYVKRYDTGTSTWVTVGGGAVSDTALDSESVDLADVVTGVPYVAYTEGRAYGGQGVDLVHVKRFASGSWQTIGGGPLVHDPNALGGGCPAFCRVQSVSIAGTSATPYVAWLEYDGTALQVRTAKPKGDQSGWDELGGSLNRNGNFNAKSVELKFVGGNPTIGWSEEIAPEDDGGSAPKNTHVAVYGQAPRAIKPPRMTVNQQRLGSLRCTTGSWSSDASSFQITWQRAPHGTPDRNTQAWSAINGAVGPTYDAHGADLGSRVRCLVSGAGSTFVGEAPSNSLQIDLGPPRPRKLPRVEGPPRTGQVLHCNPGVWRNNPDFDYEWYRDGERVGGNGNEYTAGKNGLYTDVQIACRVTAHNDVGEDSAFSNPLRVTSRVPVPRGKPPIDAVFNPVLNPVGRQVHCGPGRWLLDYGQHRWTWERDDGTPIAGASGPTYTTSIDDVGHEVRCVAYSTNPWGESGPQRSSKVLVPLPQGVGNGTKFKTGGFNEFDPVNLMALSDPYKAKIDEIVTAKYQRAVENRRNYCKHDFPDRQKIPEGMPVLSPNDFVPLTTLTQCTILLEAPKADIDIDYYGVQYLGLVRTGGNGKGPAKRCLDYRQRGHCPDVGFYEDPVTPGKEGDLDPATKMQLDPVTPEHVLWDFNDDGKADADCPSSAPVVRTMLDKGHYHVRAIIIDKHSAATGVFWRADFDFHHPEPSGLSGGLRPSQVFACRTSVIPPPDPELGSCLDAGNIGKVHVVGNFCPVDLRRIPPSQLADLQDQSPDVYSILKQMAEKRDVGAASLRPKPAHVNVPLGDGKPLAAADASQLFAKASRELIFSHLSTTGVAFHNTASALNGFDNVNKPFLDAPALNAPIDALKGLLGAQWDPKHAAFALDQIYFGHGPIKVNGTTLDPTGDYDKQPTLVTPSDAGNVAEDGARRTVRSMILNNKSAQTLLGGPAGQIPLDPGKVLKQEIGDLKNGAENEGKKLLRENINIDAYKEQLKNDLRDGEAAAKQKAREALNALDLGPLKITGTEAKITVNDDQTITLKAIATIPFLEDPTAAPTDEDQDPTAGPGNAEKKPEKGAVRVEITLKGDLDGKLTLQGVHVNLNRADLGVLELHGVDFNYDGGVNLTGDILIPPTREGVRIEDFHVDDKGRFRGVSVFYLAGAGSGIPIGAPAPVYLTSLGGGFHFDEDTFFVPDANGEPQPVVKNVAKLNAAATFSVGPSPTGGGCATLGLKTAASVAIGGIPVFVADVTGNIEVVCVPIETVHFHVDSTGFVYLTADAHVSAGPIFVHGGLKAGIRLPDWQFSIDGSGGIKGVPFLDDLHVEAAISNIGLAGCGGIKIPIIGRIAGGAAINFNNGVPPLTYPQLIANFRIFTGCDLGKYKSVLKRVALKTAAGGPKAALSTTSFTMPKGQRGVLVSLEGVGRAPRVKLKSPSGKVYDLSNATNGVRFTTGIGQIVESEDRSVAILAKPQAGVWTVITTPGSVPVNRIQIAPVLPAPSVKGNVTGKGAKRTLHYTIAKRAGQVVRFVESTPSSMKTIGTVKVGGKGKFTYLTAEGRDGRRTVIAQVSENDLPRTSLIVARYLAPNPRIGKPAHVRVRRGHGKAIVTWRRATLASSYVVSVADTHGGRTSYEPPKGKLKVTIPHVTRDEGLRVRVFGFSRAGRRGPPGIARLKAPHKHKKHHRP